MLTCKTFYVHDIKKLTSFVREILSVSSSAIRTGSDSILFDAHRTEYLATILMLKGDLRQVIADHASQSVRRLLDKLV